MNRGEVRKQAAKARRMPVAEAAYRNLVLNQRVSVHEALIPRSMWEACAGAIDEEAFTRFDTFSALDLSARNDLTAEALAAEDENGIVHVKVRFWAPETGLDERVKRDRAPYDIWSRDGLIALTPGATVDYGVVARQIVADTTDLQLVECAFDRWRMDLLRAELSKLDFATKDSAEDLSSALLMTKFGQGYADMGPAIDEVEGLFAAGKIRHGGNPVLRWQAWNAIVTKDAAGNRKLDKSKTTARIDGMVALVMAVARCRAAKMRQKSFWETEAKAA
jgi:phage terminase large subunit-like protein